MTPSSTYERDASHSLPLYCIRCSGLESTKAQSACEASVTIDCGKAPDASDASNSITLHRLRGFSRHNGVNYHKKAPRTVLKPFCLSSVVLISGSAASSDLRSLRATSNCLSRCSACTRAVTSSMPTYPAASGEYLTSRSVVAVSW